MKLVLIAGDAAAGKMTVGQELSKITDLRLFHNHMSIEPVMEIFGNLNQDAVYGIREAVFKEFAKTDSYGLIFTYMWAFDSKSDWDYISHIADIFKDAEIYCIELSAPQKIRLKRNKSENRLLNKPSKRDTELSDKQLIECDRQHRFNSLDGEIPFKNYLKIENAVINAETAAEMIKQRFDL